MSPCTAEDNSGLSWEERTEWHTWMGSYLGEQASIKNHGDLVRQMVTCTVFKAIDIYDYFATRRNEKYLLISQRLHSLRSALKHEQSNVFRSPR